MHFPRVQVSRVPCNLFVDTAFPILKLLCVAVVRAWQQPEVHANTAQGTLRMYHYAQLAFIAGRGTALPG